MGDVIVGCQSLLGSEKIRGGPGRDVCPLSSFGRLRFQADKRFQEHKCLQLKMILQHLILNPFNSVEMASKCERIEKRSPLGDRGGVQARGPD